MYGSVFEVQRSRERTNSERTNTLKGQHCSLPSQKGQHCFLLVTTGFCGEYITYKTRRHITGHGFKGSLGPDGVKKCKRCTHWKRTKFETTCAGDTKISATIPTGQDRLETVHRYRVLDPRPRVYAHAVWKRAALGASKSGLRRSTRHPADGAAVRERDARAARRRRKKACRTIGEETGGRG